MAEAEARFERSARDLDVAHIGDVELEQVVAGGAAEGERGEEAGGQALAPLQPEGAFGGERVGGELEAELEGRGVEGGGTEGGDADCRPRAGKRLRRLGRGGDYFWRRRGRRRRSG